MDGTVRSIKVDDKAKVTYRHEKAKNGGFWITPQVPSANRFFVKELIRADEILTNVFFVRQKIG